MQPAAVLGHSVGELAAAHAAGAFGLEDGLRFAAARGELMARMPADGSGVGAMAAVFASAARVASCVEECNAATAEARLSVAADNGSHQVVSGPLAGIEAISERFASEGVRVERLKTSHAFHSELMDPLLDDLESALAGVAVNPVQIALISNVTGQPVEAGQLLDGPYWRRHARETVAFVDGVAALARTGAQMVVEIGPHSVLGPLVETIWPTDPEPATAKSAPVVLATMRRPFARTAPGADAESPFEKAVARAYEAGAELSLQTLFAGERRCRVSLPTYPFRRERHWVDPIGRRRRAEGHPLLGVRRDSAVGEVTFETEMAVSDPPWLGDHRVFGLAVAPGALHGALAIAAGSLADGTGAASLQNLRLHGPLVFPGGGAEGGILPASRTVQVVVGRADGTPSRSVEVFSRSGEADPWSLHAEARIDADASRSAPAVDLEALKAGLRARSMTAFYGALAEAGVEYGRAFRGVEAVWSGEREAVGEVMLPPEAERGGLDLHPAQLDGCFQVLAAVEQVSRSDGATYLPFGCDLLWLAGTLPERVVCHVRLQEPPSENGAGRRPGAAADQCGSTAGIAPEVLTADLAIYDGDGIPVGGVAGFAVKRATRTALLSAVEGVGDLLYEVIWRNRPHRGGLLPAAFLESPEQVAAQVGALREHIRAEGVEPDGLGGLFAGLERLSEAYALAALDRLGWRRVAGAHVVPADLRRQLKVVADHDRLFHRLFSMLGAAGVLAPATGGAGDWVVTVGLGRSAAGRIARRSGRARQQHRRGPSVRIERGRTPWQVRRGAGGRVPGTR